MRKLIINADDFGLTVGVNRAIREAHTAGVVTSATMMARAGAFQDAVETAGSCPKLGVGCHIVLVDGTPVLSDSEIPSLLQKGRSNSFRNSLGRMAAEAMLGRILETEIEAEATAQIRELQKAGINVTHVDTHKHAHMWPPILRPVLRASQNCGIRRIRNPFDPAGFGLPLKNPGSWKRWATVRLLRIWHGQFQRAVREAGMITTRGTAGVVFTGTLQALQFRQSLEMLPDGVWEFVCHPGYCDDQLKRVRTRLLDSREQELRVLTDPDTCKQVSRWRYQLINYADL